MKDWEYSRLSHLAKEMGGADKLMKILDESTKKARNYKYLSGIFGCLTLISLTMTFYEKQRVNKIKKVQKENLDIVVNDEDEKSPFGTL